MWGNPSQHMMTHTLLRKCTMLVSITVSIIETEYFQASIHFLNRLSCTRSQDAGVCPSMHWLPVYHKGWHTQANTFILTFTPTGQFRVENSTNLRVFGLWREELARSTQRGPIFRFQTKADSETSHWKELWSFRAAKSGILSLYLIGSSIQVKLSIYRYTLSWLGMGDG